MSVRNVILQTGNNRADKKIIYTVAFKGLSITAKFPYSVTYSCTCNFHVYCSAHRVNTTNYQGQSGEKMFGRKGGCGVCYLRVLCVAVWVTCKLESFAF